MPILMGDNFPGILAPGTLEREVSSTKRMNRWDRKVLMDLLFGGIEELFNSEYESQEGVG